MAKTKFKQFRSGYQHTYMVNLAQGDNPRDAFSTHNMTEAGIKNLNRNIDRSEEALVTLGYISWVNWPDGVNRISLTLLGEAWIEWAWEKDLLRKHQCGIMQIVDDISDYSFNSKVPQKKRKMRKVEEACHNYIKKGETMCDRHLQQKYNIETDYYTDCCGRDSTEYFNTKSVMKLLRQLEKEGFKYD